MSLDYFVTFGVPQYEIYLLFVSWLQNSVSCRLFPDLKPDHSFHLPKIHSKDRKQLCNPSILDVGKVKRGAFAAGRKITRIISFSKKKPPRPGDPRTSYSDPRQGQTPLSLHCHTFGLQVCRRLIFPFSWPRRLPVVADESGLAGTVVLRVQRLTALLPWQRRPSDLHAFTSSPRLRRGPWAGTQTSLCFPNLKEQHRVGCYGGKIKEHLFLILKPH